VAWRRLPAGGWGEGGSGASRATSGGETSTSSGLIGPGRAAGGASATSIAARLSEIAAARASLVRGSRSAAAESDGDRLRPAPNLELPENPLDVRGDGLGADHQPPGDLVLRMPLREELQNLVLTLRQRIEPVGRGSFERLRRLGQTSDSGDQLPGVDGLDDVVVRAQQ